MLSKLKVGGVSRRRRGPGCDRQRRSAVRPPGSRIATRSVMQRPFWLAMAATVMSLVVFGATVVVLAQARHDALQRAQQTSANVVTALTGDIARSIEVYDLALSAIVDGIKDPTVMALPPEIRRRVLFDRSTAAGFISGIYAIDTQGYIFEERSGSKFRGNFADRDYFRVHQTNLKAGLYVSAPFQSRIREGALSIGLSRRLTDQRGDFAGVALIAIDVRYFQQLLSRLKVGPHGSAFVIQSDGALIARNPALPGNTAPRIPSPTFLESLSADKGSFEAGSPLDGVARLYTFSHVPRSNLIVSVAPALDDITAEWRQRSIIVAALVVLVTTSFTVAVWLLAFALRERDFAQTELRKMAETDGLTGLANRRALDAVLEELWAVASRSGQQVGILFVDADNFKAYNDAFGHNAGDEALRLIADCLSLHARRGSDVAARYGGEEFLVALLGTGEEHAATVAEEIRADIEVQSGRFERHRAQPPITVSIGYVVCSPGPDNSLAAALRLADEALYAAKRAGRNRVNRASVERTDIAAATADTNAAGAEAALRPSHEKT